MIHKKLPGFQPGLDLQSEGVQRLSQSDRWVLAAHLQACQVVGSLPMAIGCVEIMQSLEFAAYVEGNSDLLNLMDAQRAAILPNVGWWR